MQNLHASAVALALVCKTPRTGASKTRLSPPLTAAQAAALSAAFIRDVSATIHDVAQRIGAATYAIYTPLGSEAELRPLLPPQFRLLPQSEGDLGARLIVAMHDVFGAGHHGVVFVNADGPTLPAAIVAAAASTVDEGEFAIGPALDGGYTLIGLPSPQPELFTGIDWSTGRVLAQTREKARQLNLPLVELPLWYDVDDEDGLRLLQCELAGQRPDFAEAGHAAGAAAATRKCLDRMRRGPT